MSVAVAELSPAELDGLIGRVQEAAAHNLALSGEDLRLLLNALLMLAQFQSRLADQDITLHKRRKLAGIVARSERLKNLAPGGEPGPAPATTPAVQKPTPLRKPPTPPVIHQRCTHRIEGLSKGQRCPECERGTLYKYDGCGLYMIHDTATGKPN